MNFDVLIGKETEVKNKAELKSWFEDDKLYVGEYVKHKINQLDEPEVLSQDWINKFTSPVDDEGRLYVWKSDLQTLLVPNQELPLIPEYVAEWYESEGKRSSWWNWFYKWGRGGNQSDLETKTIGWMQDYNEEKFVDMFRYGYEVEQEPLYYAKIKGWEHIGTSSYYFGYDEDNDSLEVTYLKSNYRFAFSLTKKHWNKLGINDTNADFEKVE